MEASVNEEVIFCSNSFLLDSPIHRCVRPHILDVHNSEVKQLLTEDLETNPPDMHLLIQPQVSSKYNESYSHGDIDLFSICATDASGKYNDEFTQSLLPVFVREVGATIGQIYLIDDGKEMSQRKSGMQLSTDISRL